MLFASFRSNLLNAFSGNTLNAFEGRETTVNASNTALEVASIQVPNCPG